MTSGQIGIIISMAVYLGGMLLIGFWVSGRNKNVSDFYLGGRKLGPIVTAMSAEASDMSSYLLMGLPGLAYLSGMADVGWTAIGLSVGTYLNWLIVAKKLRRYTAANGSITVPSFFSKRYGDDRGILMFIAAIIIVVFFVPYTASGFASCGKLFNSLFGIDYHAAMIVSAFVIIGYTMTGGFLAASMTDLVQSIVMTVALLIVLGFGITKAGGMDNVINNAKGLAGYFSMVQSHDAVTGQAAPYGFINIVSTLAWGLGYFGMPHILLRFMAIEDDSKLKVSRRVASIWAFLSMVVAVLIGMVGLCMSSQGTLPVLEGSASETIIVQISSLLASHGFGLALVAGLVLSGILASTMSTSDSQLLAASSSISEDIINGFFHVKIKEKNLMLIARMSLLVIALIGIALAWNQNSSIFVIVSFAWAGFGGAFGPTMLLALFWRRSNKYGALAGMISGGVMIFVWKFLVRPLGGAWNIYELLPAFIVSIVLNIIVSLATPAPDTTVTDTFDNVAK
ncbi:MAG: sodium/proline symporter [Eubacterium sp.]|nr:sodium/proline symporter [Eubacterium sp.]